MGGWYSHQYPHGTPPPPRSRGPTRRGLATLAETSNSKAGSSSSSSGSSSGSGSGDGSEGHDTFGEDTFGEMPPPGRMRPPSAAQHMKLANGYRSRRRVSVSAESMTPNTSPSGQRIVHPKSVEARARILASVEHSLLFRTLSRKLLTEVVDAMLEKAVAAEEDIIRQNDEGDYFYVVESGSFDIFVNDEKVTEVGPGGHFGELALMYFAPRAATVRAAEESVVWALDRMTFRRTLMNRTASQRQLYEGFLEEVPILSSLDGHERAKMADSLAPLTFDDGDVVIRQGEPGDRFYIIEEGEASVRQEKNGNEIELVRLKKGNYFGEIALLTSKARAASVIAVGNCSCVCLDRGSFVRLLGPIEDILHRNINQYATYEDILNAEADRRASAGDGAGGSALGVSASSTSSASQSGDGGH